MKNFFKKYWYHVFSTTLTFIMVFLLLPAAVPGVYALDENFVTSKPVIIEKQKITVSSDNETNLSTFNSDITLHIPKGTAKETTEFELS